MKNKIKILFACCLTLLLTGCRSHRYTVKDLTGPHPEKARFEQVVNNSFDYEALLSKAKFSLGGTSLNGKFCLESGKRLCLQVNAPLLGFEVARVEASQEKVLLVDKYDKVYSILNLSELYQIEEISGHEMEALECLMLGRIYLPGKGQAQSRDFNSLAWNTLLLPDGSQGQSEGLYQGKNYSLLYAIDEKGQLASTQLTIGGKSVRWEYADYQQLDKNKMVPTRETITATDQEQKSISAGLSLTSPELNESNWRDFEPSNSYRQITPGELLEIIKKLTK